MRSPRVSLAQTRPDHSLAESFCGKQKYHYQKPLALTTFFQHLRAVTRRFETLTVLEKSFAFIFDAKAHHDSTAVLLHHVVLVAFKGTMHSSCTAAP